MYYNINKSECVPEWRKYMSKYENLLSGLGQKIYSAGDISSDASQMNTPAEKKALTDGIYAAKATYTDPAFFKFYSAIDRTVVFDLGAERTVVSACCSFLREDSTAVQLPDYLRLLLSNDGESWQLVGEAGKPDVQAQSAIVKMSIEPNAVYKARFAALTFPVRCWVFCDQMEIFGSKTVEDGAKKVVPDEKQHQDYPNRYVFPEDYHDVHDIMLAYNCLYSAPERGKLTKEMLLPYVGYYDREDRLSDFFFDSYLFLPFVAPAPSGGRYYDCHENPGSLDDWKYYIDNTFEEGRNVNALESAMDETRTKLGDASRRAKVFLSILFPTYTHHSFGEIDGRMLDFAKLEDRKTAVKWLIDEQLRRFNAGRYSCLKLTGFYWFHEAVSYGDPDEMELLKYTTDYVRSLGYSTIWIPWYQASGFNDWQKIGFDVACMQPNYAFTNNTARVVYANAAMTKKLGMCVEMEIGGLTHEKVARYRVYMKCGAQTGYMNALHMYYQNGGPGEFYRARLSDDAKVNKIYHDAYLFVKHRLPINGIVLDNDSFRIKKDTLLDAKLTSGSDTLITQLYCTAQHGALTLANDGTFKYIPESGFAGLDRFFIEVSRDGAINDIYEISIAVDG